jgi:hypothetical protein
MKTYLSRGDLDTIAAIDFAYAMGDMLLEQFPAEPEAERQAIEAMAKTLQDACITALKRYPCQLVTNRHAARIVRKANHLIDQGFGETAQPYTVFTAFIMATTEKHLSVKNRKNGQIAKNGWIKDTRTRAAIQAVHDAVYALHIWFDPDYEDEESLDRGCRGAAVFAAA